MHGQIGAGDSLSGLRIFQIGPLFSGLIFCPAGRMGDFGDSGLVSCPVRVCIIVLLLRKNHPGESNPCQIRDQGLFWAIRTGDFRRISFAIGGRGTFGRVDLYFDLLLGQRIRLYKIGQEHYSHCPVQCTGLSGNVHDEREHRGEILLGSEAR
jgi:hypothetical protein